MGSRPSASTDPGGPWTRPVSPARAATRGVSTRILLAKVSGGVWDPGLTRLARGPYPPRTPASRRPTLLRQQAPMRLTVHQLTPRSEGVSGVVSSGYGDFP